MPRDRGVQVFSYRERGSSCTYDAYICYHGTDAMNVESILEHGFQKSSGRGNMLGKGIYVSRNPKKAEYYGNVTLKLVAYMGYVKAIDCQGHPLQKSWQERGYDSAWVPPHCGMVASGREETCLKEPWQVQVLGVR